MRRLWWCWFLGVALLAGCGSWVVPVTPPGPAPVPVDPNPPPQPTPGGGATTDAAVAAVPEGATRDAIVAALGAPFREFDAAGFHVLQYTITGTLAEAHLFLKDGRLVRKGRFG